MNRTFKGSVAASLLAVSLTANASLIDNGAFIYDDVLNISWLADINLAATQTFGVAGIDSNGFMGWDTANSWIAAMNSANYLGHNTWRLPTLTPINGVAFNEPYLFDGSTDHGYNVTAPGTIYAGSTASELAHLFYNTLGNVARCDTSNPAGTNPDNCTGPTPQVWGLKNTGLFGSELIEQRYWYNIEGKTNPARAYDFSTWDGSQGIGHKGGMFVAWAVLDGNATAAVPVPAAMWLFSSGLLGLVAVSRRRN